MPPKKTLKDLQSSPVYGMPHEEQVRLLSDALLREYMHRRGFLDTLKTFDEENPRTAETISSRALMSDMMALKSQDQVRLKDDGIETIMEMLIDLRVEKRLEVSALQEELARPIPAVPAEYVAAKANAEKRKLKKRAKDAQGNDHSSSDDDDLGDDNEDVAAGDGGHIDLKKKDKKKKKKRDVGKKRRSSNEGPGDDTVDGDGDERERRRKQKNKKHLRGGVQNVRTSLLPGEAPPTVTLDDLLASQSDHTNSSAGAGDDDNSRTLGGESKDGSDEDSPHGQSDSRHMSRDGPYLRSVEAPAWLREAATGRAAGATTTASGARSGESDQVHDDDEGTCFEDEMLPELPPSVLEGSERLTVEAAQAACRVLLGPRVRAPPASFLVQGFTFDDLHEVGLIQWKRGPGAVMAPVQALVAALFYEKERYVSVQVRQSEALHRALCSILFKAQPDVHSICLVDGRFRKSDPCRGFMTRMTRYFRAWTDFDDHAEVEAKISELMTHHWSEEKDSGLWCFLTSVVLSRGAAAVTTDMESSSGGAGSAATAAAPTLIDEQSGDGTEALVNLCLTGRAVCFHHDGVVSRKDGRSLRGYTSSVGCGLLDGDVLQHPLLPEHTMDALTFRHARTPTFASWVVSHAGHYSNLFMMKDGRKALEQKRALGGKASVELTYWDALTDDEEVTLTVTVDAAVSLGLGGGAASAARQANASYVNRAVLQVPDWPMGLIDWRGVKVIR